MSSQQIDNKDQFNNWLNWKQDSIKLPIGKMLSARHKASEIGYIDNEGFMVRSTSIRFANKTNLTFFKLNWRPDEL